ncbi:MAG: hypothetical protein MZV64_34350 [Ignavibacteriales bacterium]|nr:hypothetical protein [Ignavibacteriales bacterium]
MAKARRGSHRGVDNSVRARRAAVPVSSDGHPPRATPARSRDARTPSRCHRNPRLRRSPRACRRRRGTGPSRPGSPTSAAPAGHGACA